jgi:hypothetical protein
MKIFVVAMHYDRGSDEFTVLAAFKSEAKAITFVKERYPKWEHDEDEANVWYEDPDDVDLSDRIFIEETELK